MGNRELRQALQALRDHEGLGQLWEAFDTIRMRGELGSDEFEAPLRDAAQGLIDFENAIRRARDAVPEMAADPEPPQPDKEPETPDFEVDLEPTSKVPNLRKMRRGTAVDAIVKWFFDNFEDPVHHTPYDGGYVYIWGGPHDAREEIYDAFGPSINEDVVEEAVVRIEEDGDEWAPSSSRLFEKVGEPLEPATKGETR